MSMTIYTGLGHTTGPVSNGLAGNVTFILLLYGIYLSIPGFLAVDTQPPCTPENNGNELSIS